MTFLGGIETGRLASFPAGRMNEANVCQIDLSQRDGRSLARLAMICLCSWKGGACSFFAACMACLSCCFLKGVSPPPPPPPPPFRRGFQWGWDPAEFDFSPCLQHHLVPGLCIASMLIIPTPPHFWDYSHLKVVCNDISAQSCTLYFSSTNHCASRSFHIVAK